MEEIKIENEADTKTLGTRAITETLETKALIKTLEMRPKLGHSL